MHSLSSYNIDGTDNNRQIVSENEILRAINQAKDARDTSRQKTLTGICRHCIRTLGPLYIKRNVLKLQQADNLQKLAKSCHEGVAGG